jgi:glutaminase
MKTMVSLESTFGGWATVAEQTDNELELLPCTRSDTSHNIASKAERELLGDFREQQLFQSLDVDNDQLVRRSDLEKVLVENGLDVEDSRLAESLRLLKAHEASVTAGSDTRLANPIAKADFCQAIRPNIQLIERVLQGNLVIPDFADFCEDMQRLYHVTRENRGGQTASYIPQLALSAPEVDRYGVALCTIDGQRYAMGDAQTYFSLQSTCKPINYCLALEEHGTEQVHAHIGHEPSGARFNDLTLNKQNRPHNPMINAGAIMSSALIHLRAKRKQMRQGAFDELAMRGWGGTRFDYVMSQWQALCGGEKPRFNTSVYLSERQTADRNFALGYFMREKGAFPPDVELEDILDFYFQCCAIEMNAAMMSVVAATLANGGICPISGERLFRTETVRNCLSLMSSCGMYDYSGEFAFAVGLPAKSGVSGAIMIVIPNVMGICTWSPRLDEHGNSVRGIDFCRRLVQTFNFHNYDTLTGGSGKKDPRLDPLARQTSRINALIWAASKGDLDAMQQQIWRGAKLSCADYDRRTPLHLAAAEGQAHVVEFFIAQQQLQPIDFNPQDRWGGTPLDDAYIHGHRRVIELLEQAGGIRGHEHAAPPRHLPLPDTVMLDGTRADAMIWAASCGDLNAMRRLVAQGVSLEKADYDRRTPLHLAAAEGHDHVVQYLIAQGVDLDPQDRWGHTPLDEAVRHGQDTAADYLQKGGCTSQGTSQ